MKNIEILKNKQQLLKALSMQSVEDLRAEVVKYTGFSVGVFSNWHPAAITDRDEKFCCSEQHFMAAKAEFFEDDHTRELIMNSQEPKRIQELGSRVSRFDEAAWMVNSDEFMFQANLLKYGQNDHMARTLLNTGDDILVYCNEADLNWGAGVNMQDPRINSPFEWPGENRLGFILMKVRDSLRIIENRMAA